MNLVSRSVSCDLKKVKAVTNESTIRPHYSEGFSGGGFVEGLGDVLKVARVEAGNGNTTVHGHVDGVLFSERVHLVCVHARVREHANLGGHVRPVMLVAQSFQLSHEAFTH